MKKVFNVKSKPGRAYDVDGNEVKLEIPGNDNGVLMCADSQEEAALMSLVAWIACSGFFKKDYIKKIGPLEYQTETIDPGRTDNVRYLNTIFEVTEIEVKSEES